jgi:tetratricopeptide (TPR) repeat protein
MLECMRYPKSMSLWRDTIDFALDHETRRQMDEQLAWIAREPANPQPYYHLAQFYRMNGRPEESRGLLLESIRLDPTFADAHASLAELYAIRGDYPAARRHAELAADHGNSRAAEMLTRFPPPRIPDSLLP